MISILFTLQYVPFIHSVTSTNFCPFPLIYLYLDLSFQFPIYIFACGTCFFMEAVAKYFHTILCFRVLTFALINQFTHYCRELRLTSAQIIPGCVIHTGYACASFILSMGLKVNKNNTYICRWFFSDLRYILDCLTKNGHPKCQLYSWYHSYLYHESIF